MFYFFNIPYSLDVMIKRSTIHDFMIARACNTLSLRTKHIRDFFFLSGAIRRHFFYPNFKSLYLMNKLTDWLEFFYGNIIWPCLLMCEVSRNLSKYNHPNQPTYPKISKQRSNGNILRNFLKFCMNNHPTLGQILGKLYGDHVITLAVIALNQKFFFIVSID